MIYDKLSNMKLYAFPNSRLMNCMQDILLNLYSESDEAIDFKKNHIMFTTTPKGEKRFEAHQRYIDIHIVLEGREYVEVSNIELLTDATTYNSESDIYFGDVASDVKFKGYLEPGYFLICFPEDTHLVGAHEQEEHTVKKIVYKVAI
ncbi:MAG: YhcH/YjgK/YiaL family protein [Candidatus Pristimantibacillus sp.]